MHEGSIHVINYFLTVKYYRNRVKLNYLNEIYTYNCIILPKHQMQSSMMTKFEILILYYLNFTSHFTDLSI